MSKEEAFVNELIGYIFAYPDDDYMTMECLCRKLHKHGLIDKKDGEWVADTPQTCEDCDHWSDTQDGCADRHGCYTPQTDCDRYVIVNDEGERVYNCIGCQKNVN